MSSAPNTSHNGRIIAIVIIIVCVVVFIMLMVGLALGNQPSNTATTTANAPTTNTPNAPTTTTTNTSGPTCVPGSCSMEAGKRYVGAASENINGPGAIKTSLNDCKSKCQANPQCKQYVYFQPNQFCYLETQIHPDAPIVDSRFTSGYCHNC